MREAREMEAEGRHRPSEVSSAGEQERWDTYKKIKKKNEIMLTISKQVYGLLQFKTAAN